MDCNIPINLPHVGGIVQDRALLVEGHLCYVFSKSGVESIAVDSDPSRLAEMSKRFSGLGLETQSERIWTNLGPIRSDVNAAYDLAAHDVAVFN